MGTKKAQVPKRGPRFRQNRRRKSVYLDLRLSATQRIYFSMNSGKKQKRICGKSPAERTVVRAAPMVCSGESPQRARRRTSLAPGGE